MHGDQVLVELGRKKEDGRAEGKILRVLTRGNPTVVGTFHRAPKHNYVTPIDEKVQQHIIIPARPGVACRRRVAGSRAECPAPTIFG